MKVWILSNLNSKQILKNIKYIFNFYYILSRQMYDIDDIRDSTYNMSRYSISVEPNRPLLVYTDITDIKLSDKKNDIIIFQFNQAENISYHRTKYKTRQ